MLLGAKSLAQDRTILVLSLLFLLGVGILLWHLARLQSKLVDSLTSQSAELYSRALAELRTVYTSEVVSRVRSKGLEVTHDYQTKEGAIPLPATFSMLLGNRLTEKGIGGVTRLYSDYPFPWRKTEGGPKNDFEREALVKLRENPEEPFYRFGLFQGRKALWFATADRMRPSCIQCHNTHPASPKRDWKEGDVRGVLEVVLPVEAAAQQARSNLKETSALIGAMSLLGLSALIATVARLRSSAKKLGENALVLRKEIEERRRAETEVQGLNEKLERRIRERTRELEAMNRELEAFSYSVSHDLRAPLRSIDGFGQALVEDCQESLSEAGGEYLQRIRSATSRMARLIDDLLGLARVARTELRREKVNLSSLAGRIIADLREREPNRQAEVRIAEGMTAEGDPRLLAVVLENLLGNAWKFTAKRDDVRIEVGVTQREKQEVHFVRDNGAGFDMSYADKLFGPFQRLHSAQDFPGTGIGLATVQRIVGRHGGRVWATGAVGKGATVSFTLWEEKRHGAEEDYSPGGRQSG